MEHAINGLTESERTVFFDLFNQAAKAFEVGIEHEKAANPAFSESVVQLAQSGFKVRIVIERKPVTLARVEMVRGADDGAQEIATLFEFRFTPTEPDCTVAH